jgi:hypothetical protein
MTSINASPVLALVGSIGSNAQATFLPSDNKTLYVATAFLYQ